MKKMEIKVLIADDFDLIRQGLKRIIEFESNISVVGEAVNGEQVLKMIDVYKPDILLLDMRMPIIGGLEVLKILKNKNPQIKIIILTVENDYRIIKEAIHTGADGYVLKDSVGKEIISAIYSVQNGDKYIDKSLVSLIFDDLCNKYDVHNKIFDELTNRELAVLYYLSKGYSNKEIGNKLFISEKTVKNYITKIFKKIEIGDRVRATIFAIENNIGNYYNESFNKNDKSL